MTPVQKFVSALADMGKDLLDAYHELDDDGDGILTMQEIRDTMPKLEIDELEQEDIDELIRILDENSDGTVDENEFVIALQNQLNL